ncbi:HDOD domain-containing protein [Parasulfuritortus cantonensis]|uniref:HDOD domain-containing protein n=1 Tax=Parasulfuritortus cantonensis TaxID=2528202 RepID=A0A4R1B1D1_9PROT|nr:HDOD domain-containing protein [Parasulfuritortus cantonensis]TCJ11581.1 HDOD domain-containing protein [Parasulfuritortus cantonensis]
MNSAAATPDDLIRDISGLVTLPDVYLRVNRLVEDPNSSNADIARAVGQDAAFTAKLLKLANSALYNFPASVDTVAKAVTIIGTAQVRNLALSLSVANSFAGLPNDLVSMRNFWKHSLLCALAARELCKLARRCDPDALFTAGLLHDIGELIIFNRLPEQARDALLMVLDSQEEIGVPEAEDRLLGFDHARVGAALARQWNLPATLQACIAWHHAPARAEAHGREVALIHIANSLAQLAEVDSIEPADAPAIDPAAWTAAGLDPEVVEAVVRKAQEEFGEIEKIFLGQ